MLNGLGGAYSSPRNYIHIIQVLFTANERQEDSISLERSSVNKGNHFAAFSGNRILIETSGICSLAFMWNSDRIHRRLEFFLPKEYIRVFIQIALCLIVED